MKNILSILAVFAFVATLSAQTDIANARTFGIGQTVAITGVATNGGELGPIRYMQDGTAGLAAYGGPIGTVNRGDSITVTGPLIDFSGLLEISTVTNVVNHGPANVQPTPLQIPIPSANESLESQLTEIQNVTFVETGNFAGNTTYTITDGTNSLDVRVNNGTDLVGTAIPTGPITITGLIGQFNANYQTVPRDLNDIVVYVAPAFEINVLVEGATVLNNGNYFVGSTSVVNITIENLGSTNLNVTGHTFTGANAAAFTSNITAGSIAGLGSQAYTMNYTPTTPGSYFAAIEIGSNDTDEDPYTIYFEGVGTDNLATEPTANATALTFPLLEAYTLGGQYTAGSGATNYLVLIKTGSPITGVPVDANTYMRGDWIGDAKVAYTGSGTSFTPRGVIANQDYYFSIYAFNGSNGFENYLTTGPTTGNVTSLGEDIGTYYSGISSASATLPTDLYSLINPHTQLSYFLYKQTMMNEFEVKDTTGGQSYVTCVYSGENLVFNDPFDWTATGYSREHTFPHSWMHSWPADNPEKPEYSDQHNLYPANLNLANQPRSNVPLGEVTGAVSQSYLEGTLGQDGTGQLVYEPRDSHKGNAARAIFYMVVAYNFEMNGNFNSDDQDQDLLKDWHFADLPDNYEIARHEYIFDQQGNRNPFIDSVEFACFIDFQQNTHDANGCLVGIDEKLENSFVIYPVPSNDIVYVQVNGTTINSYNVIDMQGRSVLSADQVELPLLEIDATNFTSGSYIIEVTTPFGKVQRKFIVE
ncbi:MAG: NADH:ubiquinone oxidoreductase subunit [Crocinitomicaceae bacterium]|jgi:NADH:ubiquinone oxidoreductase subunit